MANIRKESLANNEFYHVFTRSIAKYIVFNDYAEYERIHGLISLHRFADFNYSYSQFAEHSIQNQQNIIKNLKIKKNLLVEIIAFCIMPTHIHLLLKQTSDSGITKYMGKILNSYSKYFNIKHQRTGPLWASNFKNVLVSDDEQLLHLTRYIHLNPVSAVLTEKPDDWRYSSYKEYANMSDNENNLCDYRGIINLNPKEYIKFVQNQQSYQRELSLIKHLLINDCVG